MKLRSIYLMGGAFLLLAGAASLTPAMAQAGQRFPGEPSAGQPGMERNLPGNANTSGEVQFPTARTEASRVARPLEGEAGQGRVPCPHPVVTTLRAAGSSQGGPDFPASWAGHYASGLNDMRPNHIYAYTFQSKWPSPERVCCELVSAVLTFTVKCHGDIPGNDAWGILHNGAGVPGAGGQLGWPTNCSGQTKTITWSATPAVLAMLNADPGGPVLSFAVEDDTAVESATLQLSECCVLHHGGKPRGD